MVKEMHLRERLVSALFAVSLASLYWYAGGGRWGVAGLLAVGLLACAVGPRLSRIFPPSQPLHYPVWLAGVLAGGAYWWVGWRGGVVGLLAAGLLAWGIRARGASGSQTQADQP